MAKYIVLVSSLLILIVFNISTIHAAENKQSNIYVVKSGDSLMEIAAKFDTSEQELKTFNGLQSNLLFVGQQLYVPIIYEVVAGDTLQTVSKAYNSSIPVIKSANGLTSNVLYIGQILKIPPKKMVMQGQHILMTREEFKNWLLHHKFSRKIKLIQQHHTWAPAYKHFNGSNHFQLLMGMENYHIKQRKWKNIAQNITTFPDGKIAVSRPFNTSPEGSIGWKANFAGIMIENVGNFDKGHDVMTKEQRETIVYITALLCIKFGLTPSVDSITYHHWWDLRTGERVLDKGPSYAVKTCPGTAFFGGNTTNSAITNFYPLVSNKMQGILASEGKL